MANDFPQPTAASALDEATLHALVDGKLAPQARAAAEAALAADPQAEKTVRRWRAQREALAKLHREVLDEPVPRALHAAAERVAGRRQSANDWWWRGAMAASVLVAFGVGWLGRGLWPPMQPGGVPSVQLAQVADQRFVQQASLAYAVYQPEKLHAVEVPAAQQDHLVQWLSKRLDRPLHVPDLSAQGYALVGGRLLPGEEGARAQFMFQDAAGGRITLYLGAVAPQDALAQDSAFRFENDGPVSSFYWVDRGFGYALSGHLQPPRLQALATDVYRQLEERQAR